MKFNILLNRKNNAMKYSTNLSAAALMLFCGLSGTTQAEEKNVANITITGKVVANTCTISQNDGTQTVPLDRVSLQDLKEDNSSAGFGGKPFKVTLKDCESDAQSVLITAEGTGSGGLFANLEQQDAAKGVGIRLVVVTESGDVILKPNDKTGAELPLVASNDNEIKFEAFYAKAEQEVTVGKVKTLVHLKFSYQ